MMWTSYIYYLSKFSEFIDTFCFVARKKFNHIRKNNDDFTDMHIACIWGNSN